MFVSVVYGNVCVYEEPSDCLQFLDPAIGSASDMAHCWHTVSNPQPTEPGGTMNGCFTLGDGGIICSVAVVTLL